MADLQITIIQPQPTVQTVVVPQERVTTEVAAVQGPAGPPGTTSIPYTAAEAVSGHQGMLLVATNEVDVASADVMSNAMAVVGVSLNAAVAGDTVQVCGSGDIEHVGWSWTPGQPVYLGLAGALTQTLPPSAVFVLVIGFAVTPTLLLVNPQPPIQLA